MLETVEEAKDVGQSVISMDMIKSERICMLMKMFQSMKVKDAKTTHKEKITSAITRYQLVGEIQWIEEALYECNKKCKYYSLAGLRDSMCFLMTKCGILRGESLFWCIIILLGFYENRRRDPSNTLCGYGNIPGKNES